jgi:hypothetical protein
MLKSKVMLTKDAFEKIYERYQSSGLWLIIPMEHHPIQIHEANKYGSSQWR